MRWSALMLFVFVGSVSAANLGTPRIVPAGGTDDYVKADSFWCNDPMTLVAVKEETIRLREKNDIQMLLKVMAAGECGVTDDKLSVRVKRIVEGYSVDSHHGLVPELIVEVQEGERLIWTESTNLLMSDSHFAEIKERLFVIRRSDPATLPIPAAQIIDSY